jgi:hypothetical protein
MLNNLRDADKRRGVRAVVQAILALALIGLLYWIVGRVDAGSPVLNVVARGALIILGLSEIFYGAENCTRAFKLNGPLGTGAEFSGDDKPAGGGS